MSPAAVGLRIFFFPFMSPGHMIPMLDIATLFARRGAAATIITTPGNEPLVRPTILRSSTCPHPIQLLVISFPSTLATHSENMASIPIAEFGDLYSASFTLRQPFIDLLGRVPLPDFLISDAIFLWTAEIAAELHIPRIIFEGPGVFALCVLEALELAAAARGNKPITLDGLPHRIELTGSQIPESFNSPAIIKIRREVEAKTYGVVVNSFYELEPEYVEHYRKPGRRVWLVGPVSLKADPTERGSASTNDDEWLSWLDGRPVGSVVYVCFGSLTQLSKNQLREITAGLEDSGHPFIWAAKGGATNMGGSDKGLIINGWVPQVVILNHPAVGGFLTHCGWNSTLEAVAAGVPMATLPLFYEQYINEKLEVTADMPARSCLSKTRSSRERMQAGGDRKRTVRFDPASVIVDKDYQRRLPVMEAAEKRGIKGRVEEMRRRCEEGWESDSSSDLFELENLGGIGGGGEGKYRDELPVYKSTKLGRSGL